MDPITRARINDGMRDTLAEVLGRDVQDPRVAGVTVTGVQVTQDLAYAKVFFSVLGDAERRRVAERGLAHIAGFLRREIGKRMRLRTYPQLRFEFDSSLEYGAHIDTLLRELRDGKPKEGEDV